jgi:DNA-binding transcriptional regulator YiaG
MAKLDIAELRKKLGGISQAELGRRLGGVHQATVSRWETGEQDPDGPAAILLQQLMDSCGADSRRSSRAEAVR